MRVDETACLQNNRHAPEGNRQMTRINAQRIMASKIKKIHKGSLAARLEVPHHAIASRTESVDVTLLRRTAATQLI